MIRGQVSVVIDRPVEEVFAFVSNIENSPRYRPGVKEARQTSQGPIGVGTKFWEATQFLGRRRETATEITEYEANARVSAKETGSPIGEIAFTTTFEAVEGGTSMVLTGQAEPDGVFRLLQPLIQWATVKRLNADNARLKRLLESGGS